MNPRFHFGSTKSVKLPVCFVTHLKKVEKKILLHFIHLSSFILCFFVSFLSFCPCLYLICIFLHTPSYFPLLFIWNSFFLCFLCQSSSETFSYRCKGKSFLCD